MSTGWRRGIGISLLAVVIGLCAFAASLMPLAKNVTEPQLIAAQVIFVLAPAVLLWLGGLRLIVLNDEGARVRRWPVLTAAALLPFVVVVLAAIPTLVDVCQRPGGSCG